MPEALNYLEFSRKLSQAVKKAMLSDLADHHTQGVRSGGESSKAVHAIDEVAYREALRMLQDVPCNVYMESFDPHLSEDAAFSLFIDPVDGSLNWDRGVGDPCFALAISPKTEAIRFCDFAYAYVEGLRSGDYYYVREGKAMHYNHLLGREMTIRSSTVEQLPEAHAYLKTGYAGASRQFYQSMPLFLSVKDIRAFDNSGMELCELARGASDLMVEARQLSDFYNLLAYPIVRAAGGIISDLDGKPIDEQLIQPDALYDFVAAGNESLWQACMEALYAFRESGTVEDPFLQFSRKDNEVPGLR